VFHGAPQTAIDELNGKVYQRVLERDELETYASNYSIISNKMVGGKPIIHVFSESDTGNGFELIKPSLEDVFFSKINTTNVLV
jgi:hypothetical protein